MRGFAVLRLRDFRIFVAGYAPSTLGTQMAGVALVFAVLDGGGSPATLSYVLAARIVPMVLVLPLWPVCSATASRAAS